MLKKLLNHNNISVLDVCSVEELEICNLLSQEVNNLIVENPTCTQNFVFCRKDIVFNMISIANLVV